MLKRTSSIAGCRCLRTLAVISEHARTILTRHCVRMLIKKGAVLKGSEPLRFYSAPVIPGLPPVGVVYQVHLDDRLVRVLELWVLSEEWDASPPV